MKYVKGQKLFVNKSYCRQEGLNYPIEGFIIVTSVDDVDPGQEPWYCYRGEGGGLPHSALVPPAAAQFQQDLKTILRF